MRIIQWLKVINQEGLILAVDRNILELPSFFFFTNSQLGNMFSCFIKTDLIYMHVKSFAITSILRIICMIV